MNVNWKGILAFLGITFGITYAVEFTMMLAGVRFDEASTGMIAGQLVVMAMMWVPTLAALLTARFITREETDRFGLRLGAIRPYFVWMLLLPLIFALIYGLCWLLGLVQPDFTLSIFINMMVESGAELGEVPPSGLIVLALFVATTLTAPFLNGLIALGEEIGWRGYLLPRLMPLGKPLAYLISGVVWALWHLPLILMGFGYPGYPLAGIFAFIALVSALNVIENELYLRQNSTILAAWIHGVFNAQKLGIWGLIFVGANPLIGGYTGIVGIIIMWIVAGSVLLRGRAGKRDETSQTTQTGAMAPG